MRVRGKTLRDSARGVSFEDRAARRKEEIESLQEALRILNGEDAAPCQAARRDARPSECATRPPGGLFVPGAAPGGARSAAVRTSPADAGSRRALAL